MLSDAFLAPYKDLVPAWGPVGEIVYLRTYSWGGTRTWWQTCRCVVEGTFKYQRQHCQREGVKFNETRACRTAEEMYDRMFHFKWLPPGRGIQYMGTDTVDSKGSAVLNNCAWISTSGVTRDTFHEPFCWIMDMLMLGLGVGSDVLGAQADLVYEITSLGAPMSVYDSREGWVAVLRMTLSGIMNGRVPSLYDFSRIRAKGAPLKGMGGTASGPEPLMDLIKGILETVGLTAHKSGTTLAVDPSYVSGTISETMIADIVNLIGVCVVSGNIRRSSEILLGPKDSGEFLNLKANSTRLMAHGWASNNSILATVGMNYEPYVNNIVARGEPGFVWIANSREHGRMADVPNNRDALVTGVNPCGEIALESYELCCLVETFPANHEDLNDFLRTLKVAYLYAKTVTLIPTHNAKTNDVISRNRRIGTSQTGIQQAIAKFGLRDYLAKFCDSAYKYIDSLDTVYSEWLRVPRSIKKTAVKPSGSVSLLAGATPGVHFPESEFYIRRIRFNNQDPLLARLPYPQEPCAYAPNTTVVEFPVHEGYFRKSKHDVTIWEQFEIAALLQHWWADNQVSATVTFKDVEIKDIPVCLSAFEGRLKSISLLAADVSGYVQPVYEPISLEEYNTRVRSVNLVGVRTNQVDGKFCDGDTCLVGEPI